MEKFVVLLIPLLAAGAFWRLLSLPLKLMWKLALHTGCGFVCLWLLNAIAPFTGIFFPINAATALIAGILGIPGILVLAMLAVL